MDDIQKIQQLRSEVEQANDRVIEARTRNEQAAKALADILHLHEVATIEELEDKAARATADAQSKIRDAEQAVAAA